MEDYFWELQVINFAAGISSQFWTDNTLAPWTDSNFFPWTIS